MKKCYYARCMAIYGTPQEDRDIGLITELGYKLIGFPSEKSTQARKKKGENVMYTVFLPLVETADLVVFRALPDGRIPSGVALEIQHAKGLGTPVLELPHIYEKRVMSIADTSAYLHYVGQR